MARRSTLDVYDAGVYAYRYEATIPAAMRTPLWGPLHARELGIPGWEAQDGGETGFVYHKHVRPRKVGTMLATMIVSNRARRATLTVTIAGYPTHVPTEQRQLEALSLVTEAEVFLTRLAGTTVSFTRTAGITLVDQNHPHEELLDRRDVGALPPGDEAAKTTPRTGRTGRLASGDPSDREPPERRPADRRGNELWDVF